MSSLLDNFPIVSYLANALDILIIAFVCYQILEMMKGTRAVPLAKGIGFLLAFSLISDFLGLSTVNWLLVQLSQLFFIGILIIFAPELRSALEKLGTRSILSFTHFGGQEDEVRTNVREIVGCMTASSATRTGLLIAITRENQLHDIIATGIAIDGKLSTALLKNIFIVNTPLHDGSVVVTDGTIKAASCFLPLSTNKNISMKLGTRHRAAIGLSEVSDAVVAIVSEETGAMSIACHGKLEYGLSEFELTERMVALLTNDSEENLTWIERVKKVFRS